MRFKMPVLVLGASLALLSLPVAARSRSPPPTAISSPAGSCTSGSAPRFGRHSP